MTNHRIFSMSVASVYPLYVSKAEKKGRTRSEVDQIFRWLTGHSQETLEAQLAAGASFERFFAEAPKLNPARRLNNGRGLRGACRGNRGAPHAGDPLSRQIDR